ncbi:MAG TPA: hypothetical protein VF177_04035, partial [Anaerolineae bacterium]
MKWYYFALVALVVLLTACGREVEPVEEAVTPVQTVLVSGDFAMGRPRVAFALFDGPEPLTEVQAVELSAVEVGVENATPVWTGAAEGY